MSLPPIDPATIAAIDQVIKVAKGAREGGTEIIVTINPMRLKRCEAVLYKDKTFWGYKTKSAHQVNDEGDIVWGDSKRSK
ncbi:MAG: hypothetical protein ABSD89_06480 [Halobacteriota archaeon]|jgi:hypothetical protein